MRVIYILISLQLFLFESSFGQIKKFEPDTIFSYKKIDQVDLKFHLFIPERKTISKKLPVIIFFFGGGWTGGNPSQFYEQAAYFKSRGIVAISAEYRVKGKHQTTPFECVKDGKSAIRWLRKHAEELSIDPNKIVAAGGSAGGHVAACTGVIDGYEEEGENLNISSVPNALVLFNPVLDTTKKGYGSGKMDGRVTEISPNHHVKTGIPPTLIFHGDADTTVPFENAVRFDSLMKSAHNECKLIVAKGQSHGFFNGKFFRPKNDEKFFIETMYQTDIFLNNLGYLKGNPITEKK